MTSPIRTVALIGAAVVTCWTAAGCGAAETTDRSGAPATDRATELRPAAPADRAFVCIMIEQDRGTVDVAALAPSGSSQRALRELGNRIAVRESTELARLRRVAERLELRLPPRAEGDKRGTSDRTCAPDVLGLRATVAQRPRLAALRNARDFDAALRRQLIRRHRSATQIARAEISRGADEELLKIASALISNRRADIEQLRRSDALASHPSTSEDRTPAADASG